MTLRAVLWDLDGTLLDRDTSVRRFAAEQYERRLSRSGVPKEQYIERLTTLDGNGYTSKDELFERITQEYPLGDVSVDTLVEEFWERFPALTVVYPGCQDLLADLRRQGLALGLITNGTQRSQASKIEAAGLGAFFDTILISQVEGVSKPAPAIFLRALDRLGVAAHEAVFIGDNPVADIMGGHRVGMATIWRRNAWWDPPEEVDGVIRDLAEIPQMLRQLGR